MATRVRALAMGYAAVEFALVVITLAVPGALGKAAALTAVGLGVATLAAGIVRRQPGRVAGWWLVAAGTALLWLFGVAGQAPLVNNPASRLAVILSLLLWAGGLGILGRRRHTAAGTADVLDAALATAGAVLLAWMLVGDPPRSDVQMAVSVALSLAALLAFGAAVKLLLAAGFRVPAFTLLVLATVALLGSVSDVVLPAMELGDVLGVRAVRGLGAAHGGLLGAVVFHPSFVPAVRGLSRAGQSLSPGRIVLFGLIAGLVPIAIVIGLIDKPVRFARSFEGAVIPAVAAMTALLCLIGRLVLIARISERRAGELSRRSVALAEAMARQEALKQELAFRAMHDPLTGLSNRVVLAERLAWVLDRDDVPGPVLLLLDLDGFKDVNDTYGHPVGDELLGAVANRLLPAVPVGAVVARIGGDEFAVLLETMAPAEAHVHADSLLAAIREPFMVEDHELHVSASIGMLCIDPVIHTAAAEVLRDADLALYAAKEAGKSRVSVFVPEMRADRRQRTQISLGLHRALARGELELEYQPIVRFSNAGVVAVEALVRWRPPGSDPIAPAQFIPIAEESGLITAIGDRALRQACEDGRRWYADHGISVSVNVSAAQLDAVDFADSVAATLAATGLPAAGLILELTENGLVGTGRGTTAMLQLRELRERGVRIAIDDFGTGYSSLAYLARLPVDIVKLDSSFANGLGDPGDGPTGTEFVRAVLAAIASVGLQSVAEGIETHDQAAAFRALRCEMAQGHHFFRAMPAADISAMLSAT